MCDTTACEGLEATMLAKGRGSAITFNANGGTGTMEGIQYVGAYTPHLYLDLR